MKYLLLIILTTGLCYRPARSQTTGTDHITVKDAERILGEQAGQPEKSVTREKGVGKTRYSFKALANDSLKGIARNLYCIIENYPDAAHSAEAFSIIKTSNADMPGFKAMQGSGDEGYIQTDGQNFYFMMVRKGTRILKMKVNKITARSSFKAFEETGRRITKIM